MQVLPLGLELTVAVEDLHPVVLTVGDVDPTIGVTADVVDDVELAFTGAGSPHDINSFPSGVYLWTRELP